MSKYGWKTPKREKRTLSSSSESERECDPVNVYCRLKPLKDDNEESCIRLVSSSVLCLSSPTDSKILRRDTEYIYKHIFTGYSTQKEVFDHVAYPLLEDLTQGKNGLLFTYGVTGSGKTYTLTGDQNNPGILPRCIDTLFNTVGELQAKKFIIKSDRMNGFEVQTERDAEMDCISEYKATCRTPRTLKKSTSEPKLYNNDGTQVSGVKQTNLYAIFISYIEIYNNSVYDLLDTNGGRSLQSKILREDSQKNVYVNGATEIEVKSSLEAYELFSMGLRRKRMGHTVLNADSSRSHSIFNIRLVQLEQEAFNNQGKPMIPEGNLLKVSQLSLVDLAGSERCSRTQNTGVRLKEASSINNSLMSLRTCMEILRDNQLNNANRLVPYRDSRLTLLFKNYFEGEGRVQMIVCVNPSTNDYEENIQVMKFAEISQDVKVPKSESRYTPYRKVQKPTNAIAHTPITSKVKSSSLVFGPKIPTLQLNLDNPDDCLSSIGNLLITLRARKENAKAYAQELEDRTQSFRKRLMEINQENVLTQSEVQCMKAQIKKEKAKCHNLETKLVDLEAIKTALHSKAEEQEDVIKNLKSMVDEKDLKINQNLLAKERAKQKLLLEKEKMNQEVDEHLRRQREQLHAEMHAKNVKLQKVKQILEEKDSNFIPEMPIKEELQTPTSHHRSIVKSGSRRRSRSVGEIWLEHNSVKPVPLGTVMQPSMKKRKSVTKLSKATDITNPKQSKYCLIAQEPDTDGELETKLYKADIVPTCGGGAQVIFNDVERLRQESPTASTQK